MSDVFSSKDRSRVMRAIKSKNTTPEIRVRRALHARGLRFRLHRKDLPGAPDIVLPKWRMCLFVHGCFWHGHDCARGSRTPKTNTEYWVAKINRNIARDKRNIEALKNAGWRVEVIWECQTKPRDALETVISRIFP